MAMSQTAGSSFAPGTTGFGSIASAGTTGMPKRKQASVVEMLEYVKSLNIDPIREADMLWIAEEAFNAPLPPGWTEHQDEQCRVYFHNGSTGESTWKHPMDDLFREIVDYQRRVVEVGGFWQIEDEIAEQEENIRKDLADWMELFSEDGEKFFYNKHTEESRFDDPRMAVYHVLYARIKMVAKMKERFPILARQPRPEEPTEAEKELRRRREEDREHYMSCLLKIQTWGRVLLAKKKLQRAREKAIVQKGPQPLRGMLRLRMERVGATGAKQLVLSQTTPAKRHRAAVKIQKRIRGILTRKRFQPLVRHRCFLSKEMTKIQSMARVWLARRKVARKKQQKLHVAATKVQRTWRGYKDRQYVMALKIDKARYDRLMRSAIVIQSGVRMALARREHTRRKLIRWAKGATTIQQQARAFLLRKELNQLALKNEPVQAVFALNTNGLHRTVMPWTWQVFMAPWAGDAPGEEAEEHGFLDVFNKVGVNNWQTIAVVHCQKMVRGYLSRIRTQRLKHIALCSVRSMVDSCLEEVTRRKAAAIKIQSHARGFLVRRKNLIFEKRNAAWAANVDNIVAVQAFFKRYLAQEMVVTGVLNNTTYFAATMIQTAWRAWLARRHVERLREEALWPLKGWFEFTATGREAVQVEVCFLANPSFNDYKYFVEYGSTSTLQLTLKELEKDLASAITSVQGNQFLKEDLSRRPSGSKDRGSKARAKPKSESRKEDGKQEQRNEESQEGETKVDKKETKSKAKAAREAQQAAKEEGKATSEAAEAASPSGPQSEGGKKAAKMSKEANGADGEPAAKAKASAKGAAKAEARKTESEKKDTSGAEPQPPKPDSSQPKPPTLGTDASVREMSQSTQANELRKTTGGTAAAGDAAAPAAEGGEPGAAKPKAAAKPPNPDQGKNYAGTMRNGKFEKKKVDTVEALSKDEKAAILADIEDEKQKKLEALQEKQKQQQKKKKQQEAKVQEAQRSQMEQAEAQEEERRKQKVQELKKWLKQKEEQDRAKKERDAVLLQELQEKEVQKQEQQKVLEQARQEQRDKRLQAVAKQKAKLEAQLLASREAAIQEKINASQSTETSRPSAEGSKQESMEGPPEETDPRMRKQQLIIQQQLNERMGYGPAAAPMIPGMPQRIVHRHIHHHVHYHEGDGEEAALPSLEERRRIEQASEDRVKQKLAEQGMGELEQGFGPHGVDPIAETPTMQQSRSLPALHSRAGVQRTQEAFRPNQLPQIDALELGRKHGVPNFGQSVDRAIQSYANSGRPRYVKSGMAPPPR